MKKLVIFDCDGTLIDSEYIACEVFPRIWSSMGVPMTMDDFIVNFVGTGAGADIIQQTIAKLPPGGMEIAEKEFEKQLAENLQAVAGIPELLESIQNEKCVASNSSLPYLEKVLTTTKLKKYFDDNIYSAHEVKNPKPAADLFLYAANDLGFAPQDCLVIEDSLAGIAAAKNAGMKVIGFMGGKHFNSFIKDRLRTGKADFYCEDVNELSERIKNF